MIEFQYKKKDTGWWVSGKTKPCSSKAKMFNYIFKVFCKQLPNTTGGEITIGEIDNGIAK